VWGFGLSGSATFSLHHFYGGDPVGMTPSQTVLQYFAHSHLPEPLKTVSGVLATAAQRMESMTPDGPEKTMGLRKLLEAKDCFVRSMLVGPEKPWWQTSDLSEVVPLPSPTAAELKVITDAKLAELRTPSAADRDKWVILGECYGPVLSVANPNSEQLVNAQCYFGFCDWTFKGTNIGLPELQTKHNGAGKLK
jgi:hypothetical protein